MYRAHVLVCGGTGCTSSGSQKIIDRLKRELDKQGLTKEVSVVQTGCHGLCALGPIMVVYPEAIFYSMVKEEDIAEIVEEHLLKGRVVKRLVYDETLTEGAGKEILSIIPLESVTPLKKITLVSPKSLEITTSVFSIGIALYAVNT